MNYEIIVETKNGQNVVGELDFSAEGTVKYPTATATIKHIKDCARADIFVDCTEPCFITVRGNYENGETHTFTGIKTSKGIFRQSPHNLKEYKIDTPKEAVPLAAVYSDGEFTCLMSDNPAVYNNYTTQTVCPEKRYIAVSSGDCGEVTGGTMTFEPYYHENNKSFTVVMFKSKAANLSDMRKDVFYAIDEVFGTGEDSKFHSICFSSNYMHYRANETGSSKCWVVPGIDYCNYQYPRDAFWQSMIFSVEMEQQCYDGVYKGRYNYAESALIFLIWSYRLKKRGGTPDEDRMYDALQYIKKHVRDGWYITGESEQLALRSWYDICSFENDDSLTYNQGLYAAALIAADKLGMDTGLDAEQAVKNYNDMFLEKEGYFPISVKKPFIMCLDPTVGDLLAYVLFDKKLLDDEKVRIHYQTTYKAAKCEYGAKVTCRPDGSYNTLEDYSAYGICNEDLKTHTPGYYSWGGSYYIYEMLFHMAGYIHNVENAEENMIERSKLDFKIGGTYFEHINTATGEGNKPNQGWNCCVYPIWQLLIDKGIANDRFFKEMDKLL